MRTRLLKAVFFLAGLVVALGIGFVIWANDVPEPTQVAQDALVSSPDMTVRSDEWVRFEPTEPASVGLIIYPGGKVSAPSYAPVARAIADQGYLVVIPSVPLNLAFFGSGIANDVIDTYPDVSTWCVAGHSLGGTAAALYVEANPDQVACLGLWASYPAGNTDLSDNSLTVSVVYGTEDGLSTVEDVEGTRALLPDDTVWVPIEGGNHAQFGAYGAQSGDGVATISAEEQIRITVNATVDMLEAVMP